MRFTYWLAFALFAGCGGSVETQTTPSTGGQDSGPAGSGGAGGVVPEAGVGGTKPDAGTGGTTPEAGTGGAKPDAAKLCGGIAGAVCGPDEWCDYTYAGTNYCGGDDSAGICQPRPTGCPEDCPGTCGCDGKFYCNACMAHGSGTDDGGPGPCSPNPDAGVDCQQAIDAVAAQVTDLACTAVVRIRYTDKSLLGYQLLCGGITSLDEAKASAVSQADTGFGLGGGSLGGPNPDDVFVFYEPPMDFGGAGVVSAISGRSVFGGSIVWMGNGEITWPQTPWLPPDKLGGAECSVQMWPKWRGFDLVQDGAAYTDAEAQIALHIAWNTALPAGMFAKQSVVNANVLLYGRGVGMFNPVTAEWIVLLNSQWLE